MFAFYLAGVSFSGQACESVLAKRREIERQMSGANIHLAANFGWANDVCRDDDQERGIVLASMNSKPRLFSSITPKLKPHFPPPSVVRICSSVVVNCELLPVSGFSFPLSRPPTALLPRRPRADMATRNDLHDCHMPCHGHSHDHSAETAVA